MADARIVIPRGKLAAGLGLQALLFVAAGAAMWRFAGRELPAFVGFNWPAVAQGVAFGVALIAVAAALFKLFPKVLEHTTHLQSKMKDLFAGESDWKLFLWIALCAGVGEEALFRGGLQTLLGSWMAPAPAIFLSSLAFALFHLAKPLIAALIFLIGLVFGLVYWWTGSLLTVMIGHAVYDVWALRMLHRELKRLGYFDTPPTNAA
jgi:uncharacterized protein